MMNSNKSFLICFSLGAFFLLLLNHANADESDPRKNVNLSPFESWLSAYECLKNTSSSCRKDGYILKLSGVLNVEASDIKDFCFHGCYDHLQVVFKCIRDVKSNFKFQTNQPLSFVSNATQNACTHLNQGFNTNVTNHNSATSLNERLYMPIVSTLATMAIIATLGV